MFNDQSVTYRRKTFFEVEGRERLRPALSNLGTNQRGDRNARQSDQPTQPLTTVDDVIEDIFQAAIDQVVLK